MGIWIKVMSHVMHTVMHCVDTSPKLGYRGEEGHDSDEEKTRSKRTQEQAQAKNRNKNNTFQSDTPAGRRIYIILSIVFESSSGSLRRVLTCFQIACLSSGHKFCSALFRSVWSGGANHTARGCPKSWCDWLMQLDSIWQQVMMSFHEFPRFTYQRICNPNMSN